MGWVLFLAYTITAVLILALQNGYIDLFSYYSV